LLLGRRYSPGIIAAVKQNHWIDRCASLAMLDKDFPASSPLLLLIFAQYTSPLFPVGGMTSINHADLLGKFLDISWHMILPTLALSITSFAGLQRITRGELLDVPPGLHPNCSRQRTSRNRVIYVHALRNAVNP